MWHDNFFMQSMQIIHPSAQPLGSRQLLAFTTLARTRSFTQAGRELYLTQSAISHAVKALEDDLGCRLVDRLDKEIHLTPAGEHLLHHAEKILQDMGVAREAIKQLGRWGRGRLRIAASESIRQCVLPGVLMAFQKDFPQWPFSVEPADTQTSVELIRQNRVDLAVVIAPSQAEAVDIVPLFSDELAWIVAPGHPWVTRGTAPRAEIPAQQFVFNSARSYTYRLLEKYLARESLPLKHVLELGSLEALKETVQRGLGVTALAPWTVRKELTEKKLVAVPLGKRKLRRNWCLLRSLDRKSALAEETFVRLCGEAAVELNK